MSLVKCAEKLGKAISSSEKKLMTEKFNEYLEKGMSEYDASFSALSDYHKATFDDINDNFRAKIGLKKAEYKPLDLDGINKKYEGLAKVEKVEDAPNDKQKTEANQPLKMASPRQESQREFYSAVARTIENQRQDKFSADQIKALLNPQKTQGIKQEEVDWLGINEFLDGKDKVTKQELLDFIAENQVEIQEVVKDDKKQDKFIEGIGVLKDVQDNPTKYSQYTLPNGENYKELLLTMPEKDKVESYFDKLRALGKKYSISDPTFDRIADVEVARWSRLGGGR